MASYTFYGNEPGDYSGASVSSAGDVDGDGKDDVIIGAQLADGGGANSGEAYLVLAADMAAADAADGSTDGRIDLGLIRNQPGSYQFNGTEAADYAGFSVSSAGDVDGDGKDDLIIGAYLADGGGSTSGEVYLMMAADLAAADAADGSVDGVIDLDSVNNQPLSYQLIGTQSSDFAGYSASSAGDVDGDGKDDLIIGAYGADGGGSGSGEAYLIMSADLLAADGADGATGGVIDLDHINEQPGSYQFIGTTADDKAGFSVSSAGDVDGDGKADLIIGAYLADGGGSASGEVYVMMSADLAAADAADGSADGVIDLDWVNNQPGSYQIIGEDATDIAGFSVSSAGDVDGDGKDDLLIGAHTADGNGTENGEVYLIMSADLAAADAADGGTGGVIDLANVKSQPGSYQFIGGTNFDSAGYSVSSAGDVDGDGKDDVLIGAPRADAGGSSSGEVYLVTSKALAAADAADGSVDGVIDLDNINEQSGSYQIIGAEPNDRVGYSVSSAGDVDGDGKDDILIGARLGDYGGINAGETYLITSSNLEGLDKADGTNDNVIDLGDVHVKAILATPNADTLNGTFIADHIDALAGNDSVAGRGGNDTLLGNSGRDTLAGGDGHDSLSGGGGNDTLKGNKGNDVLTGDGGNDSLVGQAGRDTLNGSSGDDRLKGGGDTDVLNGGDDNDFLKGGTGNDTVNGGKGNDTLSGNAANDNLNGGKGADRLNGGGGNDRLNGGAGNDTYKGGDGADEFVFTGDHGDDVILDFDATSSAEKINLAAISTITGFSDLQNNHLSQQGSDVVINTGGGNSIILEDVSLADLDNSDFIF